MLVGMASHCCPSGCVGRASWQFVTACHHDGASLTGNSPAGWFENFWRKGDVRGAGMVFAGRGWLGPSSAGQLWAARLFSAGVVAYSLIWR